MRIVWRKGSMTMHSTIYLPKIMSRDDSPAAVRAADLLSLGAAPTFAAMALLTAIRGGGMPDMLCLAAQDTSPLTGMVPMYLLMSAVHLTPWLKFMSGWRSGARATVPKV
jgi:hypothetical protein